MMGQPGVMLYFDIKTGVKRLSLEEKGKLLTAILDYADDGLLPDFDGALGVAWDFIAQRVDADAARYEDTTLDFPDYAALLDYAQSMEQGIK